MGSKSRRNANLRQQGGQNQRGGGGKVISYVTDRGSDWLIAPSTYALNASGGTTAPVVFSGWNTILSIATTTPNHILLVSEKAASPGPQPFIGQAQIDEVQGSIYFTDPSATGLYRCFCGLYVAEWSNQNSTWEVRDLSSPIDSQAGDFLFLRAMAVDVPATGSDAAAVSIEVKLGLPKPIVIGQDQALMLSFQFGGPALSTMNATAFIRSRFSHAT